MQEHLLKIIADFKPGTGNIVVVISGVHEPFVYADVAVELIEKAANMIAEKDNVTFERAVQRIIKEVYEAATAKEEGTYKADFFKNYPDAKSINGYPVITCACLLYPEIMRLHKDDCAKGCHSCWDMKKECEENDSN